MYLKIQAVLYMACALVSFSLPLREHFDTEFRYALALRNYSHQAFIEQGYSVRPLFAQYTPSGYIYKTLCKSGILIAAPLDVCNVVYSGVEVMGSLKLTYSLKAQSPKTTKYVETYYTNTTYYCRDAKMLDCSSTNLCSGPSHSVTFRDPEECPDKKLQTISTSMSTVETIINVPLGQGRVVAYFSLPNCSYKSLSGFMLQPSNVCINQPDFGFVNGTILTCSSARNFKTDNCTGKSFYTPISTNAKTSSKCALSNGENVPHIVSSLGVAFIQVCNYDEWGPLSPSQSPVAIVDEYKKQVASCFAGSESLVKEDGEVVSISEVLVGDKVFYQNLIHTKS